MCETVGRTFLWLFRSVLDDRNARIAFGDAKEFVGSTRIRSLNSVFESDLVSIKLPWINLQFCYPHNRASVGFGSGTALSPKER